MHVWPFSDLTLAQRLERTEGSSNAAFIEARAALSPELGATWIDVEGTYAMFDGVGSPLTQTFGLGIFAPPTDEALDRIEAFFTHRGSATYHEVSPLAGPAHLEALVRRGYHPIEQSTVLAAPITALAPPASDSAIVVRQLPASDADHWADIAAQGWGETPELADFIRGFGRVTARAEGCHCFLASIDGTPIAAGALYLAGGVALLAGASTVPAWRRRGAQGALLRTRLEYAESTGADLAMMCAAPGSASQRNAERQGFRIAYTRTKWERPHSA